MASSSGDDLFDTDDDDDERRQRQQQEEEGEDDQRQKAGKKKMKKLQQKGGGANGNTSAPAVIPNGDGDDPNNNNANGVVDGGAIDREGDDNSSDGDDGEGGSAGKLEEEEEGDQKLPAYGFEQGSDFTVLDSVEWGPRRGEDGYDTDQELVPRPRSKPTDPCHCVPPPPTTTAEEGDEDGDVDVERLLAEATAPTCCVDSSCVNFACQEECRSNCPAGAHCGNRRIQRRQFKKVQVFDAGPKGRGLRVLEDVRRGDLIHEYTGRAVKATKLHRLFQKYRYDRRLYIMSLDKDVVLDAREKGGIARFINHSCDPNCQVQRWKVRGLLRAAVVAMRDVPAGTELTFDYQWQRQKGRAPTKCHCGSTLCRGTLEVPKSMELSGLEKELEGHWEEGTENKLDHTIINRTIRVHSEEHDEYFIGEVTGYDNATNRHCVLYRHNIAEEQWEDLRSERWMILSEKMDQQCMIARKLKHSEGGGIDSPTRSNSLLLQAAEQLHGDRKLPQKHYLYVQTNTKEAMFAKHLIERCERNCGVVISAEQFAKPPLPPTSDEDADKYAALEQSQDGTVWKLSVTGSDIARAVTILHKNVAYIERTLFDGSPMPSSGAGTAAGDGTAGGASGGGLDASSAAARGSAFDVAKNGSANAGSASQGVVEVQEIVMPRAVVDAVRRELPLLRSKCGRSTSLAFAHSESKSKQFARLLVEGSLPSDVAAAREAMWSNLVQLCDGLPKAHPNTTLPRHLGVLGGMLSARQLQLLSRTSNENKDNHVNLSMDANQDLRRFPFFASFETMYKCTVWVQADEDKGRINSKHQIVGVASPQSPRKVYLGCPTGPKDATRLFGMLHSRAMELERGVQYLYLGRDRVYQPLMISRHFFGFVQKVTGAAIDVDTMTNEFLRMDGRRASLQQQMQIDLTNDRINSMSEGDRASLAEELVRLQIELYRDHCVREQGWIFGRDWTILAGTSPQVTSSGSTGGAAAAATAGSSDLTDIKSPASSFGQLDAKMAAQGAVEIPGVVANLGHGSNVAAHAAIILYRFVSVMETTQWKVREAVLACIYLANKCQKVNKWKRLEALLEAAYETFYPGTKFDKDKEDVVVLQERVIAAEAEILQKLQYDIFWRDVQWIVSAATGGGRMKADAIERVFDFAFSGPVLSAGAELWLKYGVEYVVAASAAFVDVKLLDHLLPALGVIALKVRLAAEQLAKSAKLGRPSSGNKKLRSHPILEGGRDRLDKCIPRISEACVAVMSKAALSGPSLLAAASAVDQRYKLISQRGRRRHILRGIPPQFVKDHVVAVIDAVAAESACNIFIGRSEPGTEEVIFDGPWRAVAVAEHLLRTKIAGPIELPRALDVSSADHAQGQKIQAKVEPGCLNASDIQTSDGWEGTIQSQMSNQAVKGRRIGGKSCVAGKVSENALRRSGLRWWIPLKAGASPSGSISEMFLVRESESERFQVLVELARAVAGNTSSFPKLASLASEVSNGSQERFTAVSLQQWPSEKVGNKELEKLKSKKNTMQMGFSAAALQEMQLLTQLHSLISLPFGHPNFVLPVGIAAAIEEEQKEDDIAGEEEKKESNLIPMVGPMFSLFRSNEENEKVAEKDKKVKCRPHLLLHPTPFVLNRFMSKKHLNGMELRTNKALMAAWFHDLLSALVHCHSNNVVMRTILSDQIVVDHNGTAKLGGLYRCTVLSKEDGEQSSPSSVSWKAARSSKRKDDDEDFSNNPFVAPETLLGAPKHSKESDVWAMGSLLANLLLGKPLFVGKDRTTLLTGQFKIVGTPARENFEEAAKFPHYSKPKKKYPRGVEKALGHMLKDESAQHQKAINLIARMLHLDPRKRCTAAEALSDEYVVEYIANCGSPAFRDEYVGQWMHLKERSLTSSRDSKKSKQMLSSKRKAMLLAARRDSGDESDDLYDIDDLLEQPSKKSKG